MKVTVVGAGKMGLPLACQFASNGARVIACDVSAAVVAAINAGQCLIDEPGVPELLAAQVKAGRLSASTDTTAAVSQSEVVIVIVPAVLTPERTIDLSILESVSRQVAAGLRKGTMISFETTVSVGCTRSHLRKVLESGGLRAGVDFDLVFSPERVKSQHVLRNLTKNPKIVGGFDARATTRGVDFYARYLGAPVTRMESLEEAEFAKLLGMIYRDTNIALANELARYAEAVGVNIMPTIEAANTDGEAYILTPGIGVGGHCTPVYPYFLIRDAIQRGVSVTLAERARRVNDQQSDRVLDRLERGWQSVRGKKVLILGLGFRPQVKEHIHSTAFLLRDALIARGADVRLHDPLYTDDEIRAHRFVPSALEDTHDALILNTAHSQYRELDFKKLASRGVKAIVDGRNFWEPAAVRASGLFYIGIGRPDPPASSPKKTANYPVAKPFLSSEEAEAAAEVIRSGWVFQGPQVAAFEHEFAEYVGAPHACAVSSGTAALHLALLAVGVGPGDEVVCPSHSFIATANSIRHCGAIPVFVDVLEDTLNMDPAEVERALTPKTKAILAVHQLGMPCDLRAILAAARKRGVPVVEDAACAIGSEVRLGDSWQRVGSPHADLACFSFHPRKVLTTGEGGMITSSSAELDRKVRLWRQHGMSSPEVFEDFGYNFRMTDIQAAVGREQLKKFPWMLERRRKQAEQYHRLLTRAQLTNFGKEPAWARTNWQSFWLRLPDSVDAEHVREQMVAAGVSVRKGVMNSHQEKPYRGASHRPLPVSERARERCLLLPLYHELSSTDQEEVVRLLAQTVGEKR